MPFFSVIIPIYNGEQLIRRCVDSVLGQTFGDFELILSDDGSTDGSAAICDEYAGKDPRVAVIHSENGGVSKARNRALALAKGKYIAFCDGDDYYEKTLLEVMHRVITEHDPDMLSYQLKRLSLNEKKDQTARPYLEIIEIDGTSRFRQLCDTATWKTGGWQACRAVFKNSIIKEHSIGFCETCGNFAEDLGFTLEFLLYAYRIAFIDEQLYIYDDTRSSSMMNKSENVCKVNEVNELSYYLHNAACDVLPEEQFRVLHHHIVCGQLHGLYETANSNEFDAWHGKIASIEKIGFFKEKNKRFFKDEYSRIHSAARYIKYLRSKRMITDRYLGSLDLARFKAEIHINGAANRMLSRNGKR